MLREPGIPKRLGHRDHWGGQMITVDRMRGRWRKASPPPVTPSFYFQYIYFVSQAKHSIFPSIFPSISVTIFKNLSVLLKKVYYLFKGMLQLKRAILPTVLPVPHCAPHLQLFYAIGHWENRIFIAESYFSAHLFRMASTIR